MSASRVAVAAFAAAVIVCAQALPASAATPPEPQVCNVALQFDQLRVGRAGGAALQEIVVNQDCSVTKGPVRFIAPGTLAFEQFLASKRTTAAAKKRAADPECWSELDYQDNPGFDLTLTRLGDALFLRLLRGPGHGHI